MDTTALFAPRRLLSLVLVLALGACQSVDLSRGDLVPSASRVAPLNYGVDAAEPRAPAAIVVDADTGRTLYADEADALRFPASTTKLMTIYLVFEALQSGRLTLDTELPVSRHAASRAPSKLGLKEGSTIRLREALFGLAVKSANDVASVVAEGLGGTEERFAALMTAKARELGMTRTHYANASGLPDPGQITTARDLAILARAVRTRFPAYASLFATPGFDYAGRHYAATNKLLGHVAGVDGMKTGFINDSGFNIVVSARRGTRGIYVVVIGGTTGRTRDARAEDLIETYLGPAS